MQLITKFIFGSFAVVAVLSSLCLSRTLFLYLTRRSPPSPCGINEKDGYIDSKEAWERLKGALKIPSISEKPHTYNKTGLRQLSAYLLERKLTFVII